MCLCFSKDSYLYCFHIKNHINAERLFSLEGSVNNLKSRSTDKQLYTIVLNNALIL